MGKILTGLFGGAPKEVKPAPPPPVQPPPALSETTEAGDVAKKQRGRTSREETFLTGDLTPSEEFLKTKKKKLA